MTTRRAAFYSAEDADSLPPDATRRRARSTEGAFYLWRDGRDRALLGDDARCVRRAVRHRADGNAPIDPQGEFTGQNILYIARPIEAIAADTGRAGRGRHRGARARARRPLRRARPRPRPHLDDKVLTAWNGLMIAAFARAARVLPARPARRIDGGCWACRGRARGGRVRPRLWDAGGGRLLRRYRDGEAAIDGYAEDYAYLVFGLLELFQADGDGVARVGDRTAAAPGRAVLGRRGGGWFSTTGEDRRCCCA